jgi:HPt (histidine-containing phosphotransfer) domain-containing protein/CheY-like chemotaxis protein
LGEQLAALELRKRGALQPNPRKSNLVMSTANSLPNGNRNLRVLLIRWQESSDPEIPRQLAAAGHLVTEAADGGDAARIIRNRPVNLVLVESPRDPISLLEVVANLRGDNGRISARYTPIFVLTDKSTAFSLSGTYVDGVLTPPLDCNALVAAYFEFLSDSVSGVKRTSPSGGCCEVDAAIDRLGGDVELYKDLVTRFLDDSAGTRRQLNNAVERADAKTLHRAAHSLKGLAASVGAVAVAGALAELEEFGRGDKAVGGVASAWQRFQSEMESTADQLAAYYRPGRFASLPLN